MAFCRVRGQVEGYLNEDIGLIKVQKSQGLRLPFGLKAMIIDHSFSLVHG